MAYASKLEKLPLTYRWALSEEIDQLQEFVEASDDTSLITIGSGGSLTNAIFASVLHQYNGVTAQYLTPLELVSSDYCFRDKSVLIISAGGNNPDVLASLSAIAKKEPRELAVLCGSKKSRIGKVAKRYKFVRLCEFDSQYLQDGFLATNSVLAFAVLLFRAYKKYFNLEPPSSFDQLIGVKNGFLNEYWSYLKDKVSPLLGKGILFALFGKWGKPAAYDLESKLIESALRIIHVVDYRNFAHGRHNWLSKRGAETGVIAFVTREEKILAEKTLSILPSDIKVSTLKSEKQGPLATLELLIQDLVLTGILGEYSGMDPGRPRVPSFGRSLYHLKIPLELEELPPPFDSLSARDRAAIERKAGMTFSKLCLNKTAVEFWLNAYSSFVHRITGIAYDAAVFDYDGTLCAPSDRFTGPSETISKELNRILEYGLTIGIATGRGKSVKNDLRKIVEKRFWSNVLVGYYNGSDIGQLDDDSHPNLGLAMDQTIEKLIPQLQQNSYLNQIASYDIRPMQITFSPKGTISLNRLSVFLRSIIDSVAFPEIQVLESSHTIDLVAPRVTKLELVSKIRNKISRNGTKPAVLCIGDKGRWPGNDFALLSEVHSLSVDSVSADPHSCWNLAPEGYRGVQAMQYYFNKLRKRKNKIMLKP